MQRTLLAGLALCLAAALPAQGQKILTIDDYGQWNRITSTALSPDGAWFAHATDPNEGDATLFIQKVGGEIVHEIEVGSSPTFSDDSAWVFWLTSPGEKEAEKLRAQKKPVRRTLTLQHLESDRRVEYANADGGRFNETSTHLAIQKARAGENGGRDLLVHSLEDGIVRNIGNVASYAFDESGELLAYTVAAADKHGNGLYLLDLASDEVTPLDVAAADYSQLRWHEDGLHLAVLRGTKPEKKTQRENQLVAITGVGTARQSKTVYDPAGDEAFPQGRVLSELASLSWSKDGSVLFTGTKEQADVFEPAKDRANVDVWHHEDARVQSVQERRANQDRRRTHAAAIHLRGERFVPLGDDDLRVQIVGDGRWGLGRDGRPYEHEINWGGGRADYYRVDLDSGERQLITKALRRRIGDSPDGRYFAYLKGGVVWAHDLDTLEATNLTKSSGVDFVNVDDDHPYEKPAWGAAGWTADRRAIVLNHRYDLWLCPLDGSAATNLTAGVGDRDEIRFRYLSLDREAEWIDLDQPLLLSAYGEWTKDSGYFQVHAGDEPTQLTWQSASLGRPVKAKHADRIALTRQTFVDFPDWYVTDSTFREMTRLTEANPQQAEFAWGSRVLVDYENGRGVELQGTLTLPAGYVAGKQYPMLVYFYEKMSQRHHSYSAPRFDDRPHMCTYASDGYLVFMPDVVYVDGRPGDSAVDCVTSAVQKVIDLGYADPERIALQGHSWGGYQSSFILTQTDMFCAVVTGAPVTNLISFYGELYKSSGTSQQGIMEIGQVRMGTTPFENLELYRSQSPLHNVENITTPFVILHGTEDGAVDWHQGLEYYNAARRVGKQVVLLSYPGEPHHLRRKPNQIDFQIRMKQFFDHYCKDGPAPSWWTDGVPFLEKDKASVRRPTGDPTNDK